MRTKFDQQIIDLALQGYSNMEISNKMNIEVATISTYLESLGTLGHKNYDKELFDTIQMERSLRERTIIDKDFIDDVTNLVFEGFTFTEIALLFNGLKETDIQDYLYDFLYHRGPFQDQGLYKRIIKKQNETIEKKEAEIFQRLASLEERGVDLSCIKTSRLIRKFQRKRKIQNAVLEYIDYNYKISDAELERKYHLYTGCIRHYFYDPSYESDVLEIISKETLEEIREYRKQEKIRKVKEVHNKVLSSNLEVEEKEKLERFNSKVSLWVPLMLTFRLSIEDVAILNGIQNLEELKQRIFISFKNSSNNHLHALEYLLSYGVTVNEEERVQRREKATHFLKELSQAQLKKDTRKQAELLTFLTDRDIPAILKKTNKFSELTKEEQRRIIEYRIKYALDFQAFRYDEGTMKKNCPPDLQYEFQQVSDYNRQKSIEYFKMSETGLKR